jgi:branched-chain amino acid transport system substrate-binding protein
MKIHHYLIPAIALGMALAANPASAQKKYDVGATDTEIKIGNIMPYSGPASAYGMIGKTIDAYFKKINAEGGINGRKINFISYDDGYSPPKAVEQARKLVESDEVLFIMNPLGTPSNSAIQKYMNAKQVPQLFVATGATTFMADFSAHPYTIGWQPPYQGEARIYAKDVVANHAGAKIGVLYQNDDYGQDYLKGLTDGLGSNASMIVDKESYDVTAADTLSQLSKLKASGANTLFIFATPAFTIKSLVIITKLAWEPTIYLNSVSNPAVYMGIAAKAGAALKNVTSVAYIKDPTDPQWANDDGMKLYRTVIALCATCNPNDGFNIYGVAVAFTMVDVLKQAGSNLTRASVMSIAGSNLNETNPFLLPNVVVQTTPTDHYPITQEQVITWSANAWHLQGSLISEPIP